MKFQWKIAPVICTLLQEACTTGNLVAVDIFVGFRKPLLPAVIVLAGVTDEERVFDIQLEAG